MDRNSESRPAKAPPTQPVAAVKASRPRWLDAWRAGEQVPVSRATAKTQLIAAEQVYQPASPKHVAVLLEQTLALFGAPENWDEIAEFYLEAFETVPLDLVRKALKDARMNLKFFPKPAELRAPILDELMRRQETVYRLRAALEFGKFDA